MFALLEQRLARQPASERVVVFGADDDADYALLVRAFDGARRAGARAVAMLTDPPAASSAASP
jgi:biopolymer transport protein ExbD